MRLTFLLMCCLVSILSAYEVRVPIAPSVKVSTSGNKVKIGGRPYGEVGEPSLSAVSVKVMVPPEADLGSISVALTNEKMKKFEGSWDIDPISNPMIGENPVVKKGPVYLKNDWSKPSLIGRFIPGSLHEFKIIDISVLTTRYNPVRKELEILESAELVVNYDLNIKTSTFSAPKSSGERKIKIHKQLQDIAVNYNEMITEYEGKTSLMGISSTEYSVSTTAPIPNPPAYMIITTNSIFSHAYFPDFITSKEKRGYNVIVATEDQWGGGTGNTAADRIRAYLRQNYASKNVEYVLLVGNPTANTGDVPMKMTKVTSRNPISDSLPAGSYDCATDLYYAELTGNWDLNNNGLFGEYDGDIGAGGIDFLYEVTVGRIPVYGNPANGDYSGINALNSILNKIVKYENTTQSYTTWRKSVLIPIDSLYSGYLDGEAIRTSVIVPKGGYSYYRIYQQTYNLNPPPEKTPLNYSNVLTAWNAKPYGVVIWYTHGNATVAVNIMTSANTAQLKDASPSIVWQSSCNNARPEVTDNLSYSLLKNGAIIAIGATNVSYASHISDALTYMTFLIHREMNAGDAFRHQKSDGAWGLYDWINQLVMTLHGDPSIGLYSFLPGESYYSRSQYSEAAHSLNYGNTKDMTITYTATPLASKIDGLVGYSDLATTISGPTKMNMIVRFNTSGYFDVYNGTAYKYLKKVTYAANKPYSIKIVPNLSTKKYSVWVGSTQIAKDYVFRSGAPTMTNVGQMGLWSTQDNQLKVERHAITWDSKASISNATRKLTSNGTDWGQITFSVMPTASTSKGYIGYTSYDKTVTKQGDLPILIFIQNGYFTFVDDQYSGYDKKIPYVAGQKCKFRIIYDTYWGTYTVYITPAGGSEVCAARDYRFNSDAPSIGTIGSITISSTVDNSIKVENHKLVDAWW